MNDAQSVDEPKPSKASPRSFGLLLALISGVMALLPIFSGKFPVGWLIAVSILLFTVSWAAPVLLSGPTRAWLAFGSLLSRVVAPIALAVVFYGVFTAYGRLLRLFGRDVMKCEPDPDAATYWIERLPPDANKSHFHNQF